MFELDSDGTHGSWDTKEQAYYGPGPWATKERPIYGAHGVMYHGQSHGPLGGGKMSFISPHM